MSQNEPPQDPMSQPAPASPDTALRSVHTSNLPGLFEQLRISLVVSTYQAGKVILVRADGGVLNTHFRYLQCPLGRGREPVRDEGIEDQNRGITDEHAQRPIPHRSG